MSEAEETDVATPYKVTLKAGPGFEAPWLVIEADDTSELLARLLEVQEHNVLSHTVAASLAFRKAFWEANAAEPKPSSSKDKPAMSTNKDKPAMSTNKDKAKPTAKNDTAEDVDPIIAALDAAEDLAALRQVFPKFKGNGWTDAHTKYAQKRATALEASK